MSIYVGETVRITNQVDSFAAVALTPADVDTVTITVYDSTHVVVFGPTPMSWDATAKEWYFDWDTTGQTAGSYRAKIIVNGPGSVESWEYVRIRLARNPV